MPFLRVPHSEETSGTCVSAGKGHAVVRCVDVPAVLTRHLMRSASRLRLVLVILLSQLVLVFSLEQAAPSREYNAGFTLTPENSAVSDRDGGDKQIDCHGGPVDDASAELHARFCSKQTSSLRAVSSPELKVHEPDILAQVHDDDASPVTFTESLEAGLSHSPETSSNGDRLVVSEEADPNAKAEIPMRSDAKEIVENEKMHFADRESYDAGQHTETRARVPNDAHDGILRPSSPEAIADEFVPLHAWKEQRIEDIRKRVEKRKFRASGRSISGSAIAGINSTSRAPLAASLQCSKREKARIELCRILRPSVCIARRVAKLSQRNPADATFSPGRMRTKYVISRQEHAHISCAGLEEGKIEISQNVRHRPDPIANDQDEVLVDMESPSDASVESRAASANELDSASSFTGVKEPKEAIALVKSASPAVDVASGMISPTHLIFASPISDLQFTSKMSLPFQLAFPEKLTAVELSISKGKQHETQSPQQSLLPSLNIKQTSDEADQTSRGTHRRGLEEDLPFPDTSAFALNSMELLRVRLIDSIASAFRRLIVTSPRKKKLMAKMYTYGTSIQNDINSSVTNRNETKKRDCSLDQKTLGHGCAKESVGSALGSCFSMFHSQVRGEVKDKSVLESSREKPFNFASVDAGARVLTYSSKAVGAKNTLTNNPDQYMLVPCTGDGVGGSRWIDIELSEEVVLTSFETANFEFYSSFPRRFAVLGATSYPPKSWHTLGIFDFKNIRTIQRFTINNRPVARYLRVIFVGKQGSEYYCPISVIRAYGKTLIADWKDAFEASSSPSSGGSSAAGSDTLVDSYAASANEAPPRRRFRSDSAHARQIENMPRGMSDETVNIGSSTFTEHPDGEAYMAGFYKSDKWKPSYHQGTRLMHFHSDNDGGRGLTGEYESYESTRNLRKRGSSDVSSPADDRRNFSSNGSNSSIHSADDGETKSSGSLNVRGSVSSSSDEPRREHAGNEKFASLSKSHSIADSMDDVSEEDLELLNAVRDETLSPAAREENIFRKVTRMIRLLELNQSLTNQYIDTHLAKYVTALANMRTETTNAHHEAAMARSRIASLASSTQSSIDQIATSALKRDVLICVLLVLVALLIGAHCVLWTALSGVQLHAVGQHDSTEARYDVTDVDFEGSPNCSVNGSRSLASKRRARRNRDKGPPGIPRSPSLRRLDTTLSPHNSCTSAKTTADSIVSCDSRLQSADSRRMGAATGSSRLPARGPRILGSNPFRVLSGELEVSELRDGMIRSWSADSGSARPGQGKKRVR